MRLGEMQGESFRSFSEMWLNFVPEYHSKAYTPFHVTFPWNSLLANLPYKISTNRCRKRIDSYVIPGEFERAKTSIRFGHEKSGKGYHTQRGDFCLLAGSVKGNHLTLYYRALELIGGLHFDIPVWHKAIEETHSQIRTISIFAAHAFVFGVKGNKSMTKERLYGQVNEYHRLQAYGE
jgi:hypothetical protein